MSLNAEITRIENAKTTLKTKLNSRNDNQHQITNETIDEYGDFVDSIPQGGGGIDWSAIGYSEEPKSIKEDYNYAKNIYDNWDATQTSYRGMFKNNTTLRIAPLVDTTNGRDFSEMFRLCTTLAEVPALNCSNATSCSSMFQNCSNLETVYITRVHLSAYKMFAYCTNLKNVYLVNVLGASATSSLEKTFQECLNLTDESLDNILQICINATSFQGTKTLAYLGITDTTAYPTSRIEALPHYQDFLDAGWTIGY